MVSERLRLQLSLEYRHSLFAWFEPNPPRSNHANNSELLKFYPPQDDEAYI